MPLNFDITQMDYILINPNMSDTDHHILPHKKLKAPGFSKNKELLPFLVQVADIDIELLKSIENETTQAADLAVLLKSKMPIDDLATHLSLNLVQYRSNELYDNDPFHFWYITPRILTYLTPILTQTQKQALFSCVNQWVYYDQYWHKSWQQWQNNQPETATFVPELTEEQWLLIDHIPNAIDAKNEFDEIFAQLATQYHQIPPNLTKLNTPLGLLKHAQLVNRTYPLPDFLGKSTFTQLMLDCIVDEEKTNLAYTQMINDSVQNPQAIQDYIIYSNTMFNRGS